MYAGLTLEHLADILAALTGWDICADDLLIVGERVINLQRMFNVREGLRRRDDLLPDRVTRQPAFGYYEKEPLCAIADFEAMLDEYYSARQWDPATGIPSAEKLSDLGLEASGAGNPAS
jgi:aldehyde:ferredoxin oxidoreductase